MASGSALEERPRLVDVPARNRLIAAACNAISEGKLPLSGVKALHHQRPKRHRRRHAVLADLHEVEVRPVNIERRTTVIGSKGIPRRSSNTLAPRPASLLGR